MQQEETDQSFHEEVHLVEDKTSGLKAVIAIHSTALGPAAGGCRAWHYQNDEAAKADALRLSEGMTYKNALAGLPLGGGKTVVMLPDDLDDDPRTRTALFESLGKQIDRLKGRYITAEDVGCSVADMCDVARQTDFVLGLPAKAGIAGGDPSPWTALGVFLSIEAAVKHRFDRSLVDVLVGVQGLGHVGWALCDLLHAAGARLLVCDVDPVRANKAAVQFEALVADPNAFMGHHMDVFAPCALGAVLTRRTVEHLKAGIVCGAANNQLETEEVGQQLVNRGILYAPDFLVNAGGIINVAAEYLGETPDSVQHRVREIPHRLMRLLQESERDRRPTNALATEMARTIVRQGRGAKVA